MSARPADGVAEELEADFFRHARPRDLQAALHPVEPWVGRVSRLARAEPLLVFRRGVRVPVGLPPEAPVREELAALVRGAYLKLALEVVLASQIYRVAVPLPTPIRATAENKTKNRILGTL